MFWIPVKILLILHLSVLALLHPLECRADSTPNAFTATNLVVYKKAPRYVVRPHTQQLRLRVQDTGLPLTNIYGRVGILERAFGDVPTMCAAITEAFPDLGCEPDQRVAINTVPNDILFGELKSMNHVGATVAWGVATESPVTVAVLDTGVDYTHPDLAGNITSGYDFVDNDSDPYDTNGHGTHVAGIIGASGNNEIGITGVCWRVKIMPLRVLDSTGAGSLATVAQAVEYAVANGAAIINLSFGGHGTIAAMREAFNFAENAGVLATVAAGNSRLNNDQIDWFPANLPNKNIISVAAADGDNLAPFSDYGRRTVHLSAPGVDILSTLPGGAYGYGSGTSMASPHVAGAAALLKGQNEGLNATGLKNLILSNVRPLPKMEKKLVARGTLDLGAAMNSVSKTPSEEIKISIRKLLLRRSVRFAGRVVTSSIPLSRQVGLFRNGRLQKTTVSRQNNGRYFFRTKGPGKFRVKDMYSRAQSSPILIR